MMHLEPSETVDEDAGSKTQCDGGRSDEALDLGELPLEISEEQVGA